MQASNAIPGSAGLLNGQSRHPLSAQEIAGLRDDVDTVLKEVRDPEALLAGLVDAANMGRCSDELDRERLPKVRQANLLAVEKRIQAEGPRAINHLSTINALTLRLAPDAPEELILGRIAKLRQNMPTVRRGRPDEDSRVHMAVAVAERYREHFSKPPSSTPDSNFVYLLGCVSKAVDGKTRENMHRLAEVALRIRSVEESPSVRTYILPRFE